MLIQGTRIAMTGRMVSPGLFEMLVLLGREQALARLDRLIATL
jgi:glutamyl-tRNA synthetase